MSTAPDTHASCDIEIKVSGKSYAATLNHVGAEQAWLTLIKAVDELRLYEWIRKTAQERALVNNL